MKAAIVNICILDPLNSPEMTRNYKKGCPGKCIIDCRNTLKKNGPAGRQVHVLQLNYFSKRTAQTFASMILQTGSIASLVSRLAAASL